MRALKWVEGALSRKHRARISIDLDDGGPSEPEVRRRLSGANLTIAESHVLFDRVGGRRKLTFEVLIVRHGWRRLR